jgi:hypothetical protein
MFENCKWSNMNAQFYKNFPNIQAVPPFAMAIDQFDVGNQNNVCTFLQMVPDGNSGIKSKFI